MGAGLLRWEFFKYGVSFKSMGGNFVRSLKLFQSTLRLTNMKYWKQSNIGPQRIRVSKSVWQSLVKVSFLREDEDGNGKKLMFVATPMSLKRPTQQCSTKSGMQICIRASINQGVCTFLSWKMPTFSIHLL
jgi:hypothetical protein